MNSNILCLSYEMLLQPTSALRQQHTSHKAVVDIEKVKAAQAKFFGLDKMSMADLFANQK